MAEKEDGTPVEQFDTPMVEAYTVMHEMFMSLLRAGFTEQQAIRYIIELGAHYGAQ